MNERIKQLAIQAGGIWSGGHVEQENGDYVYTERKNVDPADIDLAQFAELIVRECARVAIEKQTVNDIAGITSKNPAKDFAYALIEHFGVKE